MKGLRCLSKEGSGGLADIGLLFLFLEILCHFEIDEITVIVDTFCPVGFKLASLYAADGIGQFVGCHEVARFGHKRLSLLYYSLPVLYNHAPVAKSCKEQAYAACVGNFLAKTFFALQKGVKCLFYLILVLGVENTMAAGYVCKYLKILL